MPNFSKKHYEELAAAARLYGELDRDNLISIPVHCLADIFERDNARFDRDRFLSACIRPSR